MEIILLLLVHVHSKSGFGRNVAYIEFCIVSCHQCSKQACHSSHTCLAILSSVHYH